MTITELINNFVNLISEAVFSFSTLIFGIVGAVFTSIPGIAQITTAVSTAFRGIVASFVYFADKLSYISLFFPVDTLFVILQFAVSLLVFSFFIHSGFLSINLISSKGTGSGRP